MKKITVLLAFLIAATTVAFADRPVAYNELPAAVKELIRAYFPDRKFAYATEDDDWFDKDYSIVFGDGTRVDAEQNGYWTEVQCTHTQSFVPEGIIPSEIKNFIKTNYPNIQVKQIERDKKGYEVKLSNGREIEFDHNFKVVDID